LSHIFIAGGGGFGLEMYDFITTRPGAIKRAEHEVIGILDGSPGCEVLQHASRAEYRGTIKDFSPRPGDTVAIAIGNAFVRRKIADMLRARGARLLTYIDPTALIAPSSTIGEGAIICAYSIVNAEASVGENVLVNVFCCIGHGAQVGAHSVLSPYCSLSGDSAMGECGFMGTRATLFPKVVLGVGCTVDAHSAVRQSAPDRKIISVRGQYLVLDNRMARGD
jgi:sugar O-acyltransferase (sialic acid O-acetyltransferase NeuD family)